MPTTKTPKTASTKAYCFRSGHIIFATEAPSGAIFLMEVPDQRTRDQVEVLARHARIGDDLFIPGVPEALDDEMALNEVKHFIKTVKWALEPKETRAKHWPAREFKSCVTDPSLMFENAQQMKDNLVKFQ